MFVTFIILPFGQFIEVILLICWIMHPWISLYTLYVHGYILSKKERTITLLAALYSNNNVEVFLGYVGGTTYKLFVFDMNKAIITHSRNTYQYPNHLPLWMASFFTEWCHSFLRVAQISTEWRHSCKWCHSNSKG